MHLIVLLDNPIGLFGSKIEKGLQDLLVGACMTDNQNSSRRMATNYSSDCAGHTLKKLGGRFAAVEIIIFPEAALQ